jgi:hypothetical protein
MKSKGAITKGLLFAFILILVPVTAVSAQKASPGSTCKVYKQKTTNQNKVFTCIKSGKKLVWNKGTIVRKPAPTPTSTPTSTPTPTPTSTLSFPVSGSDSLLSSSVCRLTDSSGNNFHLGFPITPIIRDLTQISVFAIPFEFTDSENFRISNDQTTKMFESIYKYYLQESYGKTKLAFTLPPVTADLGKIQALSLGVEAKDSPITKPFSYLDMTSFINHLLAKTPKNWNLESYDAVVLYSQDYRTFNFLGGQGWRGTENSILGQVPFDSPSGKIRSLVFGSGIPTVMTHELGHSLFGFIDLYDQSAGQSFAQGWGLMAAAYSGEMNVRGWEKWLAGWISPEEIRCTGSKTTHFLDFIPSKSNSPKLLVYPLDRQRAIVVEAMNTDLIAQEINGAIVFCDKSTSCKENKRTGLLAYTVDVNKLSALGAIVVPEALKFPNVLAESKEISIEGVLIKNLGCNTKGCFVSIGG